MSLFTHLECGLCGKKFNPGKIWNLCPDCHKPLLARYDMDTVARQMTKETLLEREPNLWRYREMLPVNNPDNVLCLGEGFTPLFRARRLTENLGLKNLYIKDEGINPTGSFKVRGLSVAISKARELGIRSLSIPSAGNAAGAMCAYAAIAGMSAHVFMPKDVPPPFIAECRGLGGEVTLVDGLITDCGKIAAEELHRHGRFDVSTLKEPYRLEGKKTMGYEVAEQMDWTLPDVIIYPTGGGTGLVGMWKAFAEMKALGWIHGKLPRMVAVQAEGCAPMVRAFEKGTEFAEPWEDAHTVADGLRVPGAVGDFLILRALRESNGTAVAVSDDEIMEATFEIGKKQGIFSSPEGGATWIACQKLLDRGWINADECVVLFITGSGHKYFHLWDRD
jgi:threonine synthase